jgi:hypothetical protein
MDRGHFMALDISVIGVLTVRTRLCPCALPPSELRARRTGSIEMDESKMVLSRLLNSPHNG